MKRTEHKVAVEKPPDYSPLLRAIMYLDEALKRGVVVGVYQDSLEVSDEDIRKALVQVNSLMAETSRGMEQLARAITRATQLPGSPVLQ
jgi:hypothetical protein